MCGFLVTCIVIAKLSDPQFCHERRVPRQNTQIPVLAGHLHFDRLLAEQLLLRRDDHQINGVGQHFSLRARFHFLGFPKGFINRADHVKCLFRNVVVLPFHDFLEAADRVFDLHVFSFEAGKLRRDEHRLRKEFFDLACPRHGALVFIGKFFDAQDGDDVLQVLVALKNRFYPARDGIVLRTDDARIENARRAGQRIDGRIDAAFHDLPAEVGCSIQVCKRRGRSRVRVVVRWNVNGLHGSDRAALGRSDALLQFANFRVEVWLVTDSGRHAPEKSGNFRTRLHKTENVINEQEHVEVLLISEVFGNRKTSEAYAETRAGWLGHLAVYERSPRFLRIARYNHAAFRHFQPQVVAFASALAHAREHGNAAVLHRDVVNQLHDENGLADARTAEEADLAAFQIRLDQIDDFDSCLEHFESGGLIFERWRWAMNRVVSIAHDRAELIDGLAENIHDAAECRAPHWNLDPFSEIVRFHAANHALDRLHRDGADAAFPEVLLHLCRHIKGLRHVVAFAGTAHGVINRREVPRFKLNVHDGADDLYDVPHACVFLCHAAFS